MFSPQYHIKKIAIITIVVLIFLLGGWIWIEQTYAHIALPGVKILGQSVSGKTYDQIVEIVNKKYDEATRDGLRFVYKNRVATIYPEVVATNDPDLFYQLFKINVDSTANNLITFGHHNNPLTDIPEILAAFTVGADKNVDYSLFDRALIKALSENFGDLERPAENPHPQFKNNQIEFTASQPGVSFDFGKAINELRDQVARLKFKPITLSIINDEPAITAGDVAPLAPKIKRLADEMPATLHFDGRDWLISREDFLRWIDFAKNGADINLIISPSGLNDFLNIIQKDLYQKPADAKFKIQNNKVVEFQGSRGGRMLDNEKTSTAIAAALLDDTKPAYSSVLVSVIELDPHVTTAKVNDLGIKEIIGIGVSNFKNSPPNRIHNIQTGAAAVNGTLISPDEEFSLLKLLGNVNEENGYLPELVIKGNKTTKEFGGGLCQIGTTMFRSTLASGLPVLERQNHSYRVSYYEPAGTDATIYDPAPDFKFKNDTGHYILIQSKIKGTEISFEFWGTKDGRTVLQSSSTIYNITKPEEPLLTPTETLPVNVKKCTEHSHDGADAKFTYTVTYPGNKIVSKVFTSHYKPWREVCLIGVPKGTLPPEMTTATDLISSDVAGASAR